jgi:hypothetical protein
MKGNPKTYIFLQLIVTPWKQNPKGNNSKGLNVVAELWVSPTAEIFRFILPFYLNFS